MGAIRFDTQRPWHAPAPRFSWARQTEPVTESYAALLRGIAPSGKNMSNAHLRGVVEGLGFERVTSVLASGNILFRGPAAPAAELEASIEAALQGQLGIKGGTIIRSLPELEALLAADPFAGLTHGPGTYLTATFLKTPLADETPEQPHPLTRILGYDAPARAILAVTDNTTPGTTGNWMARLEKTHGAGITTRTWLTVQRIVAKLRAI